MSSLHDKFRTFTEFNDFIFNTIKDEEDFVVDNVCILKIVQIGIKMNYTWRSLLDFHPAIEVAKRLMTNNQSDELLFSRHLVKDKTIIAVDLNRRNEAQTSKYLCRYFEAFDRFDYHRFVQASSTEQLPSEATKTPETSGHSYNIKEARYALKVYRHIALLCKKYNELKPFKASMSRAAQLYLDQWVAWKKITQQNLRGNLPFGLSLSQRRHSTRLSRSRSEGDRSTTRSNHEELCLLCLPQTLKQGSFSRLIPR